MSRKRPTQARRQADRRKLALEKMRCLSVTHEIVRVLAPAIGVEETLRMQEKFAVVEARIRAAGKP